MSGNEKGLDDVLAYICKNQKRFVKNLETAISIESVSAWRSSPATMKEFERMVNFAYKMLVDLGFTLDEWEVGKQVMEDGSVGELPSVILGSLGNDKRKHTLLIYGHLDVQPANQSDGWDSYPFRLREHGENLYGRGTTDDKGPVLGWLHCIEAYQKQEVDIPVNIKIVLECMEEAGSQGLEELLQKNTIKKEFLASVDMVAISDNYWIGKSRPCLTFALRGVCYFHVTVEGGKKDLHSGVFGGAVHEAMWDLTWLLSQLVDDKGDILIPGIVNHKMGYNHIPLKEKKYYNSLDFNLEDFKKEAGVDHLRFPDDKARTLMSRWQVPALSIHGIEGAFSEKGSKTVIPRAVTGKFSIRIVPTQKPETVSKKVIAYMNDLWKKRGSNNKFHITAAHKGKPWKCNYNHPNYTAAAAAIKEVYKQDAQYTREGGSIPIALLLQELTKKNVLLLPMGQSDDGAHSQNEKISKKNFICGTKVFATYLMELSKISKKDLKEANAKIKNSQN